MTTRSSCRDRCSLLSHGLSYLGGSDDVIEANLQAYYRSNMRRYSSCSHSHRQVSSSLLSSRDTFSLFHHRTYRRKFHERYNHRQGRNFTSKISKGDQYEKEMTVNTLAIAHGIVGHGDDNHNSRHGAEKLIMNQRRALSKAITLIESRSSDHIYQGDLLLNYLMEKTRTKDDINNGHGKKNTSSSSSSFRIGIAGAPGAGKSTFIEKFGIFLLENQYPYHHQKQVEEEEKNHSCDNTNETTMIDHPSPSKLAALCIDPSSTITGGSILGDKTRMTELSRHPRAFVRPSPTRGDLGGVSSHTNDAITLCQAAGYDLVVIETVGIGQSEVSASQVVDMLILIVAPGGGDGLQGVKKGIVEVADLLIVNKADGPLLPVATSTAADYKGATHFMRSRIDGWESPPVLLASAHTSKGFTEVWDAICKYRQIMTDNGELDKRKAKQATYWMWKHVQDLISSRVKSNEEVGSMADGVESAVEKGLVSPRVAASDMLKCLDLTFKS